MSNENVITRQTYEKLQEKLDDLILVKRPEVAQEVSAARAMGDLSENADYDAAREKQAKLEAEIAELSNLLKNANVVEVSKDAPKSVTVGTVVTFTNLSNKKKKSFKLMGLISEDDEVPTISTDSPLGRALMDKEVGDVVKVNAPKPYEVRIEKIEIAE